MKIRSRSTLAILAASALTLPALAQPTIRGLDFLSKSDRTYARAFSADGAAIVGASSAPPPSVITPVRWLLSGESPAIQALERPEGWNSGQAVSTNADGSVALVESYDNNRLRKYRWDANGGTALFDAEPEWTAVSPRIVAPNGDVYGTVRIADGTSRPTRWNAAGGTDLFDVPGDVQSASFWSLDRAGNIYASGWSDGADARLYRWTSEGYQFLVQPPRYSYFARISADGSSMIGSTLVPVNGQHVWIWKEGQGFTTILTSPHWFTQPTAVTPDGSAVFGYEQTEDGDTVVNFAWTPKTGVIPAVQYFADLGVDVAGWSDMVVNDVSSDGTKFIGGATNPDGRAEAFIITIPRICPADFNADGDVNSQDFFDFLNDFFANNPNADFNHDGQLNSQDFFDFLNAFFNSCN